MRTGTAPRPFEYGVALLVLGLACGQGDGERLARQAAPREGPAASERTDPTDQRPRPSTPYLRVLGTAQDGGLPHAACLGDHCVRARADATFRRLVASVAVIDPTVDPTGVYLVDATPDVREQLDRLEDVRRPAAVGVDRSPLDGIFLTHAHMGHYLGLAFFGYEAIHPQGLPLWATPKMIDFLRSNGPWSQLVDFGNVELRPLIGAEPVRLSPALTVRAITVPHRDEFADTVAFVVEGPERTALYVPDTDRWETWDPPLLERVAELGIDVALVDATFFSEAELPGRSIEEIGHPLISVSMDLLQPAVDAGVLEVWFVHLNHSNPAVDPDGQAGREIRRRGFAVAPDGLEIAL